MKVPSSSSEKWVEIVRGELKVELTSLAAKLLLTRIIAQASLDPSTIPAGVEELRSLFERNAHIPKMQEDLRRIFA